MRSLFVALGMVIVAQAASADAKSDFTLADQACLGLTQPMAQANCLDAHERQVWQMYSPGTVGLFDSFASQRAALSQQLQTNDIDQHTYDLRVNAAKAELLLSQRQAEQQAAVQAQQQQQNRAAFLCGLASAFSRSPLTTNLNCLSGRVPQPSQTMTCKRDPLNPNNTVCSIN